MVPLRRSSPKPPQPPPPAPRPIDTALARATAAAAPPAARGCRPQEVYRRQAIPQVERAHDAEAHLAGTDSGMGVGLGLGLGLELEI
eukprot:scaffold105585_cov72-Phaeocystis_antarctica.AAC.4